MFNWCNLRRASELYPRKMSLKYPLEPSSLVVLLPYLLDPAPRVSTPLAPLAPNPFASNPVAKKSVYAGQCLEE